MSVAYLYVNDGSYDRLFCTLIHCEPAGLSACILEREFTHFLIKLFNILELVQISGTFVKWLTFLLDLPLSFDIESC